MTQRWAIECGGHWVFVVCMIILGALELGLALWGYGVLTFWFRILFCGDRHYKLHHEKEIGR